MLTRMSRRCLPAALALAALMALPSAAPAATKTHVFRLHLTLSTGTFWHSKSENQHCSDLRYLWEGTGSQEAWMDHRNLLVTLRGNTFEFPAIKGRQRLPIPRTGVKSWAPLEMSVVRGAEYTVKADGTLDSCAPGWSLAEPPSVRTCGRTDPSGGMWAITPFKGAVKPISMLMFSDPYDGECPAESTHAIFLPETREILKGENALAQLRNPRVKRVEVQGRTGGKIKTAEPWGPGGMSRWGEQVSGTSWKLTFTRVG